MKKVKNVMIMVALLLTASLTVNAQDSEKTGDVANTEVFDVVEQMPEFKGGEYQVTINRYIDGKMVTETVTKTCGPGMSGLMQYLATSVRYPVVAEENGVQGRVVCTFVVERDGSISNVKVAKSVDPSLDKEAVRVIKTMPRWTPGKQKGEAVRVKYTVPVTFRLQ